MTANKIDAAIKRQQCRPVAYRIVHRSDSHIKYIYSSSSHLSQAAFACRCLVNNL